MPENAIIYGCAGAALSDWERGFFAQANPWGFILFARNIEHPDQLRRLTGDLRDCVGWNAPILIDQEGGRVQRMRAPHWREYLPALDQMALASDPIRAQFLRNRLIAQELFDVGIDVNCAPLVDLVEDQTHPVLRNRLYGSNVDDVVAAALAAADGLLAGGVLPVLKHVPGYGRASVDSHRDLPSVDAPLSDLWNRDFAPFRALNTFVMGMSAHIVFTDIDPDAPATTSDIMIDMIRDKIGFSGLLMTDDISMQALSGTIAERAQASWQARCDLVLHCNGERGDMEQLARIAPPLTQAATARSDAALSQRKKPVEIDIEAALAEFETLLT